MRGLVDSAKGRVSRYFFRELRSAPHQSLTTLGPVTNLGRASDLMRQLRNVTIVRCDEAAWRFLGLSLAGYNVLISLALAAIAIWGMLGTRRSPNA